VETWGFDIYGTDATIRGGLTPAWMERFDEGDTWRPVGDERPTDRSTMEERLAADRQRCLKRALEAFILAVRGEAPPPVDASAGYRVFKVVEAVYESTRRETKVTL
jgi:predicted dehydrogenase